MNYYKRHIGDYAKKAGRLSMLEHGAFTLLLDACYDRERFPTKQEAIEWTWARTADEVSAVEFVLSRFFDLVDGRYVQARIQEELARYQQTAETNKRIATNRAASRTKRERSVNEALTDRERIANVLVDESNEPSPNHKPITNNQEPLENPPNPLEGENSGAELPDEGVQILRGANSAGVSRAISLKTWLSELEEQGQVAIPETDPLFDYAQRVGLPRDFLQLAWVEFKRKFTSTDSSKRQKDWRRAFRNYVEGNWLRLWFLDGQTYTLTTQGKQAQRLHTEYA